MDLHVKAGSSITLSCLIKQGPHDLGTVFWYKGDNILETSQAHVNDADYMRKLTIEVCIIQVLLSLRLLFYCIVRLVLVFVRKLWNPQLGNVPEKYLIIVVKTAALRVFGTYVS